MPSPGETGVTDQRRAADLLHEARERERAACLPEAIACYEAAVAAAERDGEGTILAEALRRLAVLRRHRSEVAAATAPSGSATCICGDSASSITPSWTRRASASRTRARRRRKPWRCSTSWVRGAPRPRRIG